jgi:cytochrome c556
MAENAVVDGAQTVAPPTAGAGEGQSTGGSVLAELEADTPQADAGSTPDPWGDPEFLKRLESLDFAKAPEALRRKVEAPFVADYTKKWQAVAEERKQLQSERERIFNVALDRMKESGVQTPTQTVQDQIRERLEAGDMNAIPDLVKQEIEREVGPMRQQAALRNAIETAGRMSPMVREKEPEIAAILRDEPGLQQMAAMNNYQFAPYVLAGLADRIEKAQIAQQFEAFKAQAEVDKKAYAKRAIEEYRTRGASLPPVTSQAGSSGTSSRGEAPSDLQAIMRDAWVKAGGTLDPNL